MGRLSKEWVEKSENELQYGEMIFTLLILTQAINIILFRGGGFLNGIMGKRSMPVKKNF